MTTLDVLCVLNQMYLHHSNSLLCCIPSGKLGTPNTPGTPGTPSMKEICETTKSQVIVIIVDGENYQKLFQDAALHIFSTVSKQLQPKVWLSWCPFEIQTTFVFEQILCLFFRHDQPRKRLICPLSINDDDDDDYDCNDDGFCPKQITHQDQV